MARAQSLSQEAAEFFGCNGQEMFDDTDPHEGKWFVLQFVSDTVFSALAGNGVKGDYTGKTFLAGTSLTNALGYTNFQLASGDMIGHLVS